jgi:hypothetical protein
VRNFRKASAVALVLILAALAAQADVIITLHDGSEIRTKRATYEANTLKLADGSKVPRSRVKRLTQVHKQPPPTGSSAAIAEDVKALLATAEESVKRFPNSKSILLVDYGYEEKRANGTWLFRQRSATKILHPDRLSLASQGLYFDERRRVRFLQARSIDPDGTVHNYDPASVKISEPSRGAVHFGRGKHKNCQIPGVKVGSIVDVTTEIEVFNPYDPEMFFQWWSFAGTEPFVHSKIEIVVPSSEKVYYVTRNMPEEARHPRKLFGHGTTTYVWEMRNQPAIIEERSMPPVGDVVPHLECSPFKDWSHIKKWATERLRPRMEATETLKKLARELTEGIADVKGKIAALYHYVQRQIKYLSIKGSIASGMCGHPAGYTLETRRGDCIDSATLLSALLRAVGIKEAYPVWVNTNDSSTIPTEIPTLSGNHAITEIRLDGDIFYLDPTATHYRYPTFRMDDHGVYAINPILAEVRLIPVPDPSREMISREYEVTLAPDGSAGVGFSQLSTGSWESYYRRHFSNMNREQTEKFLRSFINSYSPGATLESSELKHVEELGKQFEWRMGFKLPGYAVRAGDLLIFKIPGLSYSFPQVAPEQRKYDIDYKTSDERRSKVTVNIPEGYTIKYMPPPLKLDSKYVTYEASCRQEGGSVVFEDRYRHLTRFVPVADYQEHRELLRRIARYSREHIFFEKKK